MSTPENVTTRALLEETAWLSRLAARLVKDGARAEDAVQETLLAALRRPAHEPAPGRGWLATVLRNALRQESRASTRRATRESLAAVSSVDEVEDPTDEVAARLEVQQRLVECVRALDEPYRSTIALRFLDDLSPREVARRLDVPVKTVHTRIERGLERLRSRLDAHHGGRRRAWALLLGPLALPRLTGTTGLGALTMSTTTKWVAAAAGVCIAGWLALESVDSAADPVPPGSDPGAVLAAPSDARPLPAPPGGGFERTEVARAIAPRPVPASAVEQHPTFEGVVVDLARRPVAGVEVTFVPEPPSSLEVSASELRATSDSEGRFRMRLFELRGRLRARGQGLADIVSPGMFGEPPPEPPVVVVAPRRSYAGRVVEPDGAPVVGARVSVQLTEEVATEVARGAMGPWQVLQKAVSDEDGAFAIEAIGFAPGLILAVHCDGYESTRLELPDGSTRDVLVQLHPLAGRGTVAGVVLDPDGHPVEGAYVSALGDATRTDAGGFFALEVSPESEGTLRAVSAGHLPAERELSDVATEERGHLELVLGGRPLSVRGTVRDAGGRGLAGARVMTWDGLRFGNVASEFGDMTFMLSPRVEDLLAGTLSRGEAGQLGTVADAQGRFELSDLLDRPYTLFAMHPVTFELARLADVRAGGPEVTIVIPGLERRATVAGRVLTTGGVPVPGAEIRVRRRTRENGALTVNSAELDGFLLTTDEEGRFRLEDICVEDTTLLLIGEVWRNLDLSDAPDLLNLEFRVPVTCHLRVVLVDPSRADTLMVLDGGGRSLPLTAHVGANSLGAMAMGLEGGESDLLETNELARTLVLYKNGEEVERVSLELTPGEVNEVRL